MKKRRLRESLVDIEFDEKHFSEMYGADSHYYKDVFDDIVSYIDEHYTSLSDLPDFQEFVDTCVEEDTITGGSSGSYLYSRLDGYGNIFRSNDDSFALLCVLLNNIYGDNDGGVIMKAGLDGECESLDILIRCELCYPIIEWLYDNINQDDRDEVGVELSDEDYDEGFEESLRRHRARIKN